jgi:glycosyltransferase involved in cell wall biosynthesis
MKILHLVTNLSPNYGGPVKACIETCEQLARSGDEVSIYTTNLDFPAGKLDVQLNEPVMSKGVEISYFSIQFTPYVVSWGLARALYKNIKKFDLVHIHGLYRFPQAIGAFLARRARVPYIVRPHGSLDPYLFNQSNRRRRKRLYEWLIENRNLNGASAIQFTTQDEMELVAPLKLRAPAIVVPNSLNIDQYNTLPEFGLFRKKYKLEGKQIVLHYGRITEKKGLDIVVRAFAKASKHIDDACLVIAGPDNEGYSSVVRNWIAEENIGAKTVFTGMLQGEQSLEVLRDADIFVLPSYSENFGMAVVEAMACRLPVIISNRVNIWREVEQAEAGFIIDCNIEELSEALCNLFDNDALKVTMGRSGKRLVEHLYNDKVVTEDLRRNYKQILANSTHG